MKASRILGPTPTPGSRNPRVAGFLALVLASCAAAPRTDVSSPLEGNVALTRGPASLDPREFLAELAKRLERVPEFRAIHRWAKENGVRVWAGGGTATGITSYLREELRQASGARGAIEGNAFPYAYFDIYRSTQDADIVIDGDEATAQKLEAYLREKLGYLQGSKELWEVRLLRQPRGSGVGKKDALLGDPSFRGQNSDSFSLGLVEISDPPPGESRVRDLFDWENQYRSRFLRDVLAAKVTFIRNPGHARTARAAAGYNPEIVSVIRAYTKAFQYDAEIEARSLADLRAVIDGFDPSAEYSKDAVRYVKNSAAKLFQHARDLERAANELDRFGLRKKLIAFARIHQLPDLERLLGREPLRTHPLGSLEIPAPYAGYVPTYWTARRLGITRVAHEAGDFLAYENITMSRLGKANLLISRGGTLHENAVHGDGAYTRVGDEGARGTGLTVRFAVDPDAIEGRDFFLAEQGQFAVFRNAAALRVLPAEQSRFSLLELVRTLDAGNFKQSDLGVIRKLELQALSLSGALSADESAALFSVFRDHVAKHGPPWKVPASFSIFARIVRGNPDFRGRVLRELGDARPASLMGLAPSLGIGADEAYVLLAKTRGTESTADFAEKILGAHVGQNSRIFESRLIGELFRETRERSPERARAEARDLLARLKGERNGRATAYAGLAAAAIDDPEIYRGLIEGIAQPEFAQYDTVAAYCEAYLILRRRMARGEWNFGADFDRELSARAARIAENAAEALRYNHPDDAGSLRKGVFLDALSLLERSGPEAPREKLIQWSRTEWFPRIDTELIAALIRSAGGLDPESLSALFPPKQVIYTSYFDAIHAAYPAGIPSGFILQLPNTSSSDALIARRIPVSAAESIGILEKLVDRIGKEGIQERWHPLVAEVLTAALLHHRSRAEAQFRRLFGTARYSEGQLQMIAALSERVPFSDADWKWLLDCYDASDWSRPPILAAFRNQVEKIGRIPTGTPEYARIEKALVDAGFPDWKERRFRSSPSFGIDFPRIGDLTSDACKAVLRVFKRTVSSR